MVIEFHRFYTCGDQLNFTLVTPITSVFMLGFVGNLSDTRQVAVTRLLTISDLL